MGQYAECWTKRVVRSEQSKMGELLNMIKIAKTVEDFEEEAEKPLGRKNDDDPSEHLVKMSDYQAYCKGLMNIALLSANASQLREAIELCQPMKTIIITLMSLSISLQVAASGLLVVERMTCKKEDYIKCHKYNVMIGILCVFIIVVNFIAISIGGPKDECDF